ncbi:hypothetical protein BDV11DRAFT_210547 [Aspergillus similis]
MSGIATSGIAAAVTQSGGLGLIGFVDNFRLLERELRQAKSLLQEITLPIGVGIIVAMEPRLMWLSFGGAKAFKDWTESIRQTSPNTKVWIQLGSVQSALEVAQSCRTDALARAGSSIKTLLPDVADSLPRAGIENMPLIAAGGIMDGRGVAAALALGTAGVVMGTRFLGAVEADLPQECRDEVMAAWDWGESTVRSRAFDEMWADNPRQWVHDGRCLRNQYYEDSDGRMGAREMRERLYWTKARSGKVAVRDTSSLWVGAGVGMLRVIESARNIVHTASQF